jgi:hypothetical protein
MELIAPFAASDEITGRSWKFDREPNQGEALGHVFKGKGKSIRRALSSHRPGTEKFKKVAAAAGGNTVDLAGQR